MYGPILYEEGWYAQPKPLCKGIVSATRSWVGKGKGGYVQPQMLSMGVLGAAKHSFTWKRLVYTATSSEQCVQREQSTHWPKMLINGLMQSPKMLSEWGDEHS